MKPKHFAVGRTTGAGATSFVVVAPDNELDSVKAEFVGTGVPLLSQSMFRRLGGQLLTRDLDVIAARVEVRHRRLAGE